MARISLWKPDRGNDFNFVDRQVREVINMGGTGVFLHKYVGPPGGNQTTISDVVFMENRARKYDEVIYELRGHYNPADADFDLSQFGMFLSSDTIFLDFHLNDHVDKIGRKIMSGDVIELPHLREYYGLNEDNPAANKYFSVEDAYRGSSGFGPTWASHIWRVKAKALVASEEYSDILGRADGTGAGKSGSGNIGNLYDILTSKPQDLSNMDALTKEAACNMPYDPPYLEALHYFVQLEEDGTATILWDSGTGTPPNGLPLLGTGTDFPDTMLDGEYFLRTDFNPYALFVKNGCRYTRVLVDQRKCPWTPANRKLDTFIDNKKTFTELDGTVVPERQAISKVVLPRDGE